MIAKRAQLSPECGRFFRSDPEPVAVAPPPAGRPVNIKPTSVKPASTKKPATTNSTKTKKPAKPSAT